MTIYNHAAGMPNTTLSVNILNSMVMSALLVLGFS